MCVLSWGPQHATAKATSYSNQSPSQADHCHCLLKNVSKYMAQVASDGAVVSVEIWFPWSWAVQKLITAWKWDSAEICSEELRHKQLGDMLTLQKRSQTQSFWQFRSLSLLSLTPRDPISLKVLSSSNCHVAETVPRLPMQPPLKRCRMW